MRDFVKHEEFLPLFASCNRNFTVRSRDMENNIWCGTCPKCAFAFALLAAYVPKHTVVSVFGKDLFDDTSLLPTFRQLLGIADFKPFECVGTFEEVRASFMLISQKHEFDGSVVMKMFLSEVSPGLIGASKREVGESGNISLVPGKFLPLVNKLL
jgi:hypothetical protein